MTVTPIKVSKIPTDLGESEENGEMLMVMRVQGICTHHEVWLDYNTFDYYYIVAPESGEVNSLRRWARTPQDVLLFKFDTTAGRHNLNAWESASAHCLKEATEEIRQEHSL